MNIEKALRDRSGSKCELCGATEELDVYQVPFGQENVPEGSVLLCGSCREQIEIPQKINIHHWRCLSDSMWNPVAAVQVLAWRMLMRLKSESWAQDLLDMLYLDDDTLAWAKAGSEDKREDEEMIRHLDCNGAVLESGDTVTLIKDLNVKGAGFTAKRGTAVRGISVVGDNPQQIEGRINGQQIVILTQYVKKAG